MYVVDIHKKHPFNPIHLSHILEKLSDNAANTKLELMNQYSQKVRVQGGLAQWNLFWCFWFPQKRQACAWTGTVSWWKRVQTCSCTVKTISPGRLLANQDRARADEENNVLFAFVPPVFSICVNVYVHLSTFKLLCFSPFCLALKSKDKRLLTSFALTTHFVRNVKLKTHLAC